MAVAVLQGDMVAARALSDLLQEEYQRGGTEVGLVKRIVLGRGPYRIMVFPKDGITLTEQGNRLIRDRLSEWLMFDRSVAIMPYIDRVEVYEFPTAR